MITGQSPRFRSGASHQHPHGNGGEAPTIHLSAAARLCRSGKEIALVIGESGGALSAATPLTRLLSKAHRLQASLVSGEVADLDALARREAVGRTYLARVLRLAHLAPSVVEAILAGCEPEALTVNRLMKQVQLPLDWAGQRRVLEFG